MSKDKSATKGYASFFHEKKNQRQAMANKQLFFERMHILYEPKPSSNSLFFTKFSDRFPQVLTRCNFQKIITTKAQIVRKP